MKVTVGFPADEFQHEPSFQNERLKLHLLPKGDILGFSLCRPDAHKLTFQL